MTRSTFGAGILLAGISVLVLTGCSEPAPEISAVAEDAAAEVVVVEAPVRDPRLALFAPLPEVMESADNPITLAKVNLGRKLYYDPRLSKNHDVSCNTCHLLDKFGVDGLPTSVGHREQVGSRNAPTVYNAAGHIVQFWDGRAATIEDQAKGSPLNPVEMAMADEAAVETVLQSIPGYAPLFSSAFPEAEQPITFDNMAKAIGAFERGLVTHSRFDDYLAGDDTALTDIEVDGLNAFLDVGCGSCHSGTYVGGSMYQRLGLVEAWVADEDMGRFEVTGNDADKRLFKVPTLRNVSHTGPYFHSGSVGSLNEAVRLMGKHQLGMELSNEQVISIIAFLNSLDGEVDQQYIAIPELPESGENTPAPDPS